MRDFKNETTFSDEIIAFLFSARSSSVRKKILWELVKERREISKHVYNQSLYRLKKRGIIENSDDLFILSGKGKKYFINPLRKINKKIIKKNKVMIIFDIPERQRKARNWLRNQIKDWDFKMIQRSVWIGYGPLPKEFNERLEELKIDGGVKVYNLQNKK